MARLQILELPAGDNDDRPPFALVIDQADHDSPMCRALTNNVTRSNIIRETGARTILVFADETIDIPANEVPVDPDGYPLKIRIEPDFTTFRDQVEEQIRYAQGRITRALPDN